MMNEFLVHYLEKYFLSLKKGKKRLKETEGEGSQQEESQVPNLSVM